MTFGIPRIHHPCSQRVRFMRTYPKSTHYLVSKMILTREMDGRICIAVHVLSFAHINHLLHHQTFLSPTRLQWLS